MGRPGGQVRTCWSVRSATPDVSLSMPKINDVIASGRLRDECLNVEWFSSLDDARQKLGKFREHYNHQRPHSALADRTPAAFAELHRPGKGVSTLMGRALQSLLIESLEYAKPAWN